ncbi:MAG TPA: type IV secretion system protein [Caulobacteraceae bacterium]
MSIAPGCPAFDAQDLGVAHALDSVDCRLGVAVASSYGRLFGHDGAFGTVLTVVLTLFVAFIALGLLTGRTRLTLSGMVPKVLGVGLVLTFATSWPAYHTVIYGLLVGGPEQIAVALTGGGGDTASFANHLDDLLSRLTDVTKVLGDDTPGASKALGPLAGPQIASSLVWISGMLILLASAGALVLTRIVLALLLAIGPVFIVLALFRQTRGLFEGWLRTGLLFALAPTLTVLAGSAALALLDPLVDAIADDPAGAVKDLRPILELFLGSVVYAGLVAMLMWTSASLVRGWRFGETPEGAARSASTSTSSSSVSPSSPIGAAPQTASSATPPNPRVGQVVASLARDGGEVQAPVSVRVEQARSALQSAAGDAPRAVAENHRRTEGLGQGFRPAARPAPLSGAVR